MNITFIGGGNMAEALIGGLLRKGGAIRADALHVVEINRETRDRLQAKHPGVQCFAEASQAVRGDDVIVFAVKPQDMRRAAGELREKAWSSGRPASGNLVISIAAGVRLTDLSRWLGNHRTLVRAMPNMAALIGQGISGLCALEATEEQMRQAEQILGAVGSTVRIRSEEDMDTVTAVSGSGPAYVFWFIEQLAAAGASLGLSQEISRKLALETVLGSARLAERSADSPSVLRERVTSKGGTTEAALKVFDEEKLAERFRRAIEAAKRRGAELGEVLGKD